MFYPLPHISSDELPQRFTYPFHYEAHPLCLKAAEELQAKLTELQWDNKGQGKMFGVLIVRNKVGELGYLWAYSGNHNEKLDKTAFVPPIYDLLDPSSFFIDGEKGLIHINKQISQLEKSEVVLTAKKNCNIIKEQMMLEIETQKAKNKTAKGKRKSSRESKKTELSTEDFRILDSQLIKESQREKSVLKQLKNNWEDKIQQAQEVRDELLKEISLLKAERKRKSAALQQGLFDQYQLLNAKGEVKSLCDIFQESIAKQPPAAAGDCAAPRLLQYAYKEQMQPLAMAEFWWGKSPTSIIRKEGNYYPACRGKCEPILGHMLLGLDVDDNPMNENCNQPIEIIYQDAELLAIDKPAGMLSVQGKTKQTYVLEQLEQQGVDISDLHIVHRLDMATSGILLIAKSEAIYKDLQSQFLSRLVKKRYEAILEGKLSQESGKIELPLRVDLDNRPQQMVCHEHGKAAMTLWKAIECRNDKTRIYFYPITGRTHQLRVHAAHLDGLNTPIVGDELYGTKAERMHLHAGQLEFTHPISGIKMRFTSKCPF